MISAVDAKRMMDECDINKELKMIEDKILTAVEEGYEDCILDTSFLKLPKIKIKKIKKVLEELGYEIKYDDIISISWASAGDGEEWVEKQRYDGSLFYVCGKCGGVAAAEKEDTCPNCRCRMKK